MNGQGPQEFLGYDLGVNSDILAIIALLLVVVGLFLAFAGRIAWRHVMSFIGAIVGGLIGFAIGTAIGGWLVGFMVSVLAAIVGSALFIFVANVAIGLVSGLLAFMVAGALTENSLIGLVAGLIAFVVTIAFIEAAIGVVTAVVGGFLVGIGAMWLGFDMLVVVIVMLASMVLGGAFQMLALREEAELRARATRVGSESSVAMAAAAPPAPPPVSVRSCARCGGQMSYVPEYNRYYCQKCSRYD